MAARLGACLLPTSINLMLHGITAVSLLVDQRKMIFYNKTLHSSNTVLRVVFRLHLYEAQRLFSVYHVSPRHIGNVDILSGPFGFALLVYSDFDFTVFLLIFFCTFVYFSFCTAVFLAKTYCLPILLYGCET